MKYAQREQYCMENRVAVREYIRHRLSIDATDAVYVAAIRDLRGAVDRFNGGLDRLLRGGA